MAEPEQPYDFTKFAGYSVPNTTQIPDEFLDQHMAFLSGAEVKVMLYIFRRTLGFKRYADNISLNQLLTGIVRRDGTRLDHGTGLSRSTLVNAIRGLVEKKLVTVEQRQSDDRGNEPTTYHLNFATAPSTKIELGVSENHTPPSSEIELALVRKSVLAPSSKIEPTIYSSTTDSNTINSNNNNNDSDDASRKRTVVVALLVSHGVGTSVAQTLADAYPEELVSEKIAYLEFLLAERPTDVRKPAAWLRRAIEQDYGTPDGFVSESDRKRQAEEEARLEKARLAAEKKEAGRRQAQQKAREQQRAQILAAQRAEYGTTDADEEQWAAVIQEVKFSGEDTLYGLIADSQILQTKESTLLVGVPSPSRAQQLAHPRVQTLLKRTIKRVLQQDFAPEFVVVESTG